MIIKKIKRAINNFKDRKVKSRQLSTPKKLKALLIGINYYQTPGQLYGCINDVRKMKKLLEMRGYTEFMILTEEDEMKPTKTNILKGFEWLIKDNESYDKIFLHYSGHGSWLKDITSDEVDGRDECLVPLDFKTNGMILDDDIYSKLVNHIKCDFMGVIDACHSGSMLDLKFNYHPAPTFTGGNKNNRKNYTNTYVTKTNKKLLNGLDKKENTIMVISGCQDKQTSADAWLERKSQGALTYCFYKTIRNNRFNISTSELMKNIHLELMSKNFTQRPVLSCNKSISLKNNYELY